jgi:hypothetical protein
MFSFGKKHFILINSLQLTIHYSIDFLAVIIIISTLMLSNANEYITIIINIIITDNNYAAKIVDATVVSVRHPNHQYIICTPITTTATKHFREVQCSQTHTNRNRSPLNIFNFRES